ncbi:MAG: hypothetical protein WDO14_24615 [Bacteroidota bacterium]
MNFFTLRKTVIAITAASVVAILGSLYAFSFVPSQKEIVNGRGFRILKGIEQNIIEKKRNLAKTLDEVYSKVEDQSDADQIKSPAKAVAKLKGEQLVDGLTIDKWIDSATWQATFHRNNWMPSLDAVNGEWVLTFFGKYRYDPSHYKLKYDYDVDKFFSDIVDTRRDFFDDFIVIDSNKNILYHTGSMSIDANFKLIDEKINKTEQTLISDVITRDTINDKQYLVFCHKFPRTSGMDFVICGLVSVEKYNQDRFLIDNDSVIWLVFFFMIATCLMPFIKFFTLTRYEHLRHQDLIRIAVALTLGCMFISLATFFGAATLSEDFREKSEIRKLSASLAKNINDERGQIVEELEYHRKNLRNGMYDQWIKENKKLGYYVDKEIPGYVNKQHSSHFMKSLVVTDKEGIAWGAWLNGGTSPDLNLSGRDYVKVFTKKNAGLEPNFRANNREYYFQPIYSWVDQENTIMVSSKVDDEMKQRIARMSDSADKTIHELELLCIETKFFSLSHTALPNEMSFCIIDQTGNVLFHSREVRNLRENFIEEINGPADFMAAMRAGVSTTMKVQYYGRTHVIYSTPIKDMPLTLVTLYDKGYYLDSLSNQLTFVLAMIVALGLLIGLIFLTTMTVSRRVSYLKRSKGNLRWLSRLAGISRKSCIILFVAMIVPFIAMYVVKNSLERLIIISAFMMPLFAMGIAAALMFKLYREKYLDSEYRTSIRWKYRAFSICCLVGCSLLFWAYLNVVSDSGSIEVNGGIFAGSIILLFLLAFSIEPDVLSFYKPRFRDWWKDPDYKAMNREVDFRGNWQWTGLKFIFLSISFILFLGYLSAFPALTFFISSMREERALMQKRNSLEMAEKSIDRYKWLSDSYFDFMHTRYESTYGDWNLFNAGIYQPGKSGYVKPLTKEFILEQDHPANCTDDACKYEHYFSANSPSYALDSIYLKLINIPNNAHIIDPFSYFDAYEMQSIHLFRNQDEKKPATWSWVERASGHEARYRLDPMDTRTSFAGVAVQRETPGGLLASLDNTSIALFLVLAVIIVSIMFFAVYKVYRLTSLIDYFNKYTSDGHRHKADVALIEDERIFDSTNLLVISLPETKVVKVVTQSIGRAFEHLDAKKVVLGKMGIPHEVFVVKPGYVRSVYQTQEIIVLPYFDLTVIDFKKCLEGLAALKELFEDKHVKIIWITSSAPANQIATLSKRIADIEKKLSSAKKDGDTPVNPADLQQLLDVHKNFNAVTGNFERINYALEDNLSEDRPMHPVLTTIYIEGEFRFGAYFAKLRKQVVGGEILGNYFTKTTSGVWINKFHNADELFVLKIQELASHYYHSIWSHLTSKEKYVLYDLALDELTNYRNHSVLAELESKGILYFNEHENRMKIFNKSFRNFILTVIEPDDAMALEREINLTSTWESIRLVMFVILIGFVVFMFATDQKGLNKTLGLFSTVTALGPAFVSFLMNFRKARFGS